MYSEINNQDVYDAALKLCRGSYQEAILYGSEALSGATLRGKALSYKPRYQASSTALIDRCQAARLNVREEIREHGKRVVVIG